MAQETLTDNLTNLLAQRALLAESLESVNKQIDMIRIRANLLEELKADDNNE